MVEGLCEICREADFPGMFTNCDGDQPYRAAFHTTLQVLRTWAHVESHANSCSFCRLTYLQLRSYRRSMRRNLPQQRLPFDETTDSYGQDLDVAIVTDTSGLVGGNLVGRYIGFHNGAYRFPSYDKLIGRAIQVRASGEPPGSRWSHVRKKFEDLGSKERESKYHGGKITVPDLRLSVERHFGGRPVRRDCVDVELCKSWLKLCDDSHKDCQKGPSSVTERPPARLIDVRQGCLVSCASPNASYAALSYVWGCKAPEITLTTKTEASLRRMGSLSESDGKIGRTIRDAMTFCRKIGLLYLWVDSLCIKQDKGVLIDPEINRMYEIYSQAALVLVAVSGASFEDPLPGVRPGTRSGELQYEGTVQGLKLITCYPSVYSVIEKSVWLSRGWTLQEAAFAKRLLFFTPSQAVMLCRQTMYCEESVWEWPEASMGLFSGSNGAANVRDGMLLNTVPRHLLEEYLKIIQDYTRRALGQPSDILRACDAVIKWLATDSEESTRCIFGLPERRFGLALTWSPINGHCPRWRRLGFPSWSWAGWHGPVEWNTYTLRDERIRKWGASGIIEQSELDKELQRRYSKPVAPVRKSFSPLRSDTTILEFTTTGAYLFVSDQPKSFANPPKFNIISPSGSTLGELACDATWRHRQPEKLEFIVIGASRLEPPPPPVYGGPDTSYGCGTSRHNAKVDGRFYTSKHLFEAAWSHWQTKMEDRIVVDLMCIERKGDRAERVHVCSSIPLEDWMQLNPEETHIRLG